MISARQQARQASLRAACWRLRWDKTRTRDDKNGQECFLQTDNGQEQMIAMDKLVTLPGWVGVREPGV